jgi:hypothetical protein
VSSPVESDEGLLHEVLGRIPVVGEEARQPHESGAFQPEQLGDERVAIGGNERGGNLIGHHEQPFLELPPSGADGDSDH